MLFAAGLAIVAAPCGASAQALACGAVVTADVRLTTSLTDCADGLVIGADGITVDLGGHVIAGLGSETGTGIEAVGRTGVTVRNGRIRGFAVGVRFDATEASAISKLSIRGVGVGIALAGAMFGRIEDNRVLAATESGMRCEQGGGHHIERNRLVGGQAGLELLTCSAMVIDNVIADNLGAGLLCLFGGGHLERNRFEGNQTGAVVGFCPSDLVRNVASGNASSGIHRERSEGLVEGNKASDNGESGIHSSDSHGLFLRNVTNRNGRSGLAIVDQVPSHGPFHTVTRHLANGNGQWGIQTSLTGVLDGGRNRAHANGEAAQCLGVPCN
jgi:hypothetical protein